jgi:hypothetical protein
MSERSILEKHEERLEIYYRDKGICRYCGNPVSIHEFQVAHVIANAKWARKMYGGKIIDHPMNKACTHSGICNDLVQCTNRPLERDELAERIKETLEKR